VVSDRSGIPETPGGLQIDDPQGAGRGDAQLIAYGAERSTDPIQLLAAPD